MKRMWLILCVILALLLTACSPVAGEKEDSAVSSPQADSTICQTETGVQPEEEAEIISYPFEDEQGRIRHQLSINGEIVKTDNLPFSKTNERGAYLPVKDVLAYLGVDCLCSEDASALAARVNGNVIRLFAGKPEMIYGDSRMAAQDANIVPTVIDGILYAPSFLFMKLSDSSIVDLTGDKSAATLTTDVVIDKAGSGTEGLSLLTPVNEGSPNPQKPGFRTCPKCGGSGIVNQVNYENVWQNNRWMPAKRTRMEACRSCGGSGKVK